MSDLYYVEERSGVIGLGPLTNSPHVYQRRSKINWGSITTWIHLIICLLAIPLIIWNLYHLMDTILFYTQKTINPTSEQSQYTDAHPFALIVVLCAILMNLLGALFALVTESACFSENLAKFIYIIVYLSLAISIYVFVFSNRLLGPLWMILLLIIMVLYGIGFWRFTITSHYYLNEEGPTWFKPLLYGCLAAIPLLSTSSQCKDTKYLYGCLPNDLFGGRYMSNDFYSFFIMTMIAIISAIPYLLGIPHNQ